MDHELALFRNTFFAGANLAEHSLEEAALRERRFTRGTVIFREGDAAPDMFFVVAGRVGIFRRCGESRLLLAEIGPGGYFGEVALVDGGARSAEAEALDDVEALSLDDPTFDQLLERVPQLAVFFLKATSKRLRAVNRQVVADRPAASPDADPVADHYPFPIASVWRSMTTMADPRPRMERFFDLLEVVVRYLGVLALAQYVAANRTSEAVGDMLVKGLRRTPLGQWLLLIDESLRAFEGHEGELLVPALHAARFERPGRRAALAEDLDGLVRFRNQQRHRASGALADAAVAAALAEHEPKLRSALERMSFLADAPLVWCSPRAIPRTRRSSSPRAPSTSCSACPAATRASARRSAPARSSASSGSSAAASASPARGREGARCSTPSPAPPSSPPPARTPASR